MVAKRLLKSVQRRLNPNDAQAGIDTIIEIAKQFGCGKRAEAEAWAVAQLQEFATRVKRPVAKRLVLLAGPLMIDFAFDQMCGPDAD